MVKKLIEKAFC